MKTHSFLSGICFLFFTVLLAAPGSKVGEQAPDFKLKSLTGNSLVSLSSLKGKVVLVDFWASWCAPCKISMPHLAQLTKKYKDFTIVAVNIDDEKEKAIKFLDDLQLNMNAVYDSSKAVVTAYDVPEMPTAYLIDQYGQIKYRHSGYSEEKLDKLEFAIRGLLDRK